MTLTPHLDQLLLDPVDRQALEHNGFVASERRGQRVLYKLRFRVAGLQRVRSLGADLARAESITQELRALQAERHARLAGRRLAADARQLLRQTKSDLEPLVVAAGYKFHGRTIRRPRRSLAQPAGGRAAGPVSDRSN